MKLCCLADLHGNLPEIPPCDLVIIAGDITPPHQFYWEAINQTYWLNGEFAEWTQKLPCKEMVFIAGNHDRGFEQAKSLIDFDKIRGHYLYNSSIELLGKKIWGSPYTPWFNDWSFNFQKNNHAQAQLCWSQIPDDTQLVITHGPPYGCNDTIFTPKNYGYKSVGDIWLKIRLQTLMELELHICGHVHEGNGLSIIENTPVYSLNACYVDETFHGIRQPWTIDLPIVQNKEKQNEVSSRKR